MPADRVKVLAYKIEESLRCNECGTRRDEWEHDHNSYLVETDRCIGCEKIGWEQHAWAEDKVSTYGLKFHLVKPNAQSPVRLPVNKP